MQSLYLHLNDFLDTFFLSTSKTPSWEGEVLENFDGEYTTIEIPSWVISCEAQITRAEDRVKKGWCKHTCIPIGYGWTLSEDELLKLCAYLKCTAPKNVFYKVSKIHHAFARHSWRTRDAYSSSLPISEYMIKVGLYNSEGRFKKPSQEITLSELQTALHN